MIIFCVFELVCTTKSSTSSPKEANSSLASSVPASLSEIVRTPPAVLDANGNLRNTYDILLDIAKVYKEIQEEDKKAGTNRANALVEAIAGKNRSNIASSILLNPEMLESVYNSALDADGAAMKELDSYMESLDAKVAQFQNRLQELESDLVSSDFLKGIVDFGTGAIHVLDQLIDKFGVLPTLAPAIAAAFSFKNVGRDKMYSLSF